MRDLARTPRGIATAAVAVLAVGASVGGIAAARGGNGTGAFVPTEPESGYAMTLKQSDRTFTLASIHIRRPGDEVRVLEVKALTSPNVQSIGAVNVWPDEYRYTPLGVGPGFPSPDLKVHHSLDETVPASETNLAPLPGVTLAPPLAVAVGFRVVSGDLGAVNGVRVVYTANGKKITEDFRQSVIVCVKPRSCKTPDGEDSAARHDAILNQFGLLPKDS